MIEVIATGTGDRVVFVHGDVFGAEATWATQRPLADNYRLLLMNRRGFGHSPDVEGEDFGDGRESGMYGRVVRHRRRPSGRERDLHVETAFTRTSGARATARPRVSWSTAALLTP